MKRSTAIKETLLVTFELIFNSPSPRRQNAMDGMRRRAIYTFPVRKIIAVS